MNVDLTTRPHHPHSSLMMTITTNAIAVCTAAMTPRTIEKVRALATFSALLS